jgi:hypothetical protein
MNYLDVLINTIIFVVITFFSYLFLTRYYPIQQNIDFRDALQETNYDTSVLFSTYQIANNNLETDEIIFDKDTFIYSEIKSIIYYNDQKILVNLAMTLQDVSYSVNIANQQLLNNLHDDEIVISANVAEKYKISVNDVILTDNKYYSVKGFVKLHSLINVYDEPSDFGLMIVGDNQKNHRNEKYIHLGSNVMDFIESHNEINPTRQVIVIDIITTAKDVEAIDQAISKSIFSITFLFLIYYMARYIFINQSLQQIRYLYHKGIGVKKIITYRNKTMIYYSLPSIVLVVLVFVALPYNEVAFLRSFFILTIDFFSYVIISKQRGKILERFRNRKIKLVN